MSSACIVGTMRNHRAGRGTSLVESYLVQGMGHVWPGPAGDDTYTDHAGPDASAIIWDFAERHPKSQPVGAPRMFRGLRAGFLVLSQVGDTHKPPKGGRRMNAQWEYKVLPVGLLWQRGASSAVGRG